MLLSWEMDMNAWGRKNHWSQHVGKKQGFYLYIHTYIHIYKHQRTLHRKHQCALLNALKTILECTPMSLHISYVGFYVLCICEVIVLSHSVKILSRPDHGSLKCKCETKQPLHKRTAQHRWANSSSQESSVHLHLNEKGYSFEDGNGWYFR